MTVKDIQEQLDKWAEDSDVWLYEQNGIQGLGIWPPESTLTEPEHVIEIP